MKILKLFFLIFLIYFSCTQKKPEPVVQPAVQMVVQMGHTNEINSINISSDGKYIVSASKDGTMKLWETETGKEIRTFADEMVSAVSFSPDRKYIASGSLRNTIKLWETETGRLLRIYKGHTNGIQSINFSPDGKLLVSGSADTTIKIWETLYGKEIRSIKPSGNVIKTKSHLSRTEMLEMLLRQLIGKVISVNFSPDGKFLISGFEEIIQLWDVLSGKEISTFKGHASKIESVSFSPDGKYIASGSWDKLIKLWDIQTGKEISTFRGHTEFVESVSFSPDGKYIASGSGDKTIKLWEIQTGKEIRTFSGHTDDVVSVSFSKGREFIASGSRDKTIRLWDIRTGKEIRTLGGNMGLVWSVSFSPNGKYIATGSDDSTVKLWETETGKQIQAFIGHTANSISFSPDGKYIASSSWAKPINLWETKTGKQLRTFKLSTFNELPYLYSVSFSPDGRYITCGNSGNSIMLWETETGKEIRKFGGNTKWIRSVSFSPDGKYIAGSIDKSIQLWEVQTGEEIRTFTGSVSIVDDVKFSPDGKYIANSSGETIYLWETETGKQIRKFSGHIYSVQSLSFSPNGKYIASGGENTINLWEVETGKLINTLNGHTHLVNSVCFSPDGRYISSGSWDGKVKIWDLLNFKEVISMFSVDKYEYICITPDNYYSSSKGAFNGIAFVINSHAFSPEQFDLQYNRPDIVLERIGYASKELIEIYHRAYEKRLKKMDFTEDMFRGDFHVPEIEIINKDNLPISTTDKTLSLTITAFDDKPENTIDRINVFINDVSIYGFKGVNTRDENQNKVEKNLSIELNDGKNKIQVSCLNDKGAESLKETFEINYDGPESESKTYYVGIGVSNYQDNKLNLKYSVKDIQDMASLFRAKSNSEIITLTDAQTTRENIIALKDKLMQTKVDDDVIVSFSGHGFLSKDYDFYFATYDIDHENPEQRGISYDELESLLDGIPARKKLLLIDACHSGELDKEGIAEVKQLNVNINNVKGIDIDIIEKDSTLGLQNSFELMQELFANLSRGSGAVVISAAGGKEFAYEDPKWSNGVFTYCILKGLKEGLADLNKNGQITVSELKSYVGVQVEELTGGNQKPTSRQENLGWDFKVW